VIRPYSINHQWQQTTEIDMQAMKDTLQQPGALTAALNYYRHSFQRANHHPALEPIRARRCKWNFWLHSAAIFCRQGVAMSPYDLIDITHLTEPRAALLCARLRLRTGRRHLQKGQSAAGMVALYDAMLFGMRYYIIQHKRCESFVENADLWDAVSLFHALTRAGVFDDPLTFNRLSLLVERALWQGSSTTDADSILTEFEEMLSKLGILPLDKAGLPGKH
jgi:hypothetical protein